MRKHAGAVQVRNDMTLVQRKAFSMLLVHAYGELPDTTILEHRIPVSTLSQLMGFNSNNVQSLKEAVIALMSTPFEWNIVLNNGRERWSASTALASAVIEDGMCTYAFSPELRRRLYDPSVYAQLDVALIRAFKGRYGLALYENCMLYADCGSTPELSPEKWRELLGATEGYYDDWRRLNERVIKSAVEEVNRVTHLRIEPVVQREARKVATVRFDISTVDGTGGNIRQIPTNPLEGRDAELMQKLQTELGIGYGQVVTYCEQYSDDHLKAVFAYVLDRIRAKKLTREKAAGYFYTVIKKAAPGSIPTPQSSLDFAAPPAATSTNGPSAEQQAQAAAQKRKDDEIKAQRQKQLNDAWAALLPERQEQVRSEFMDWLAGDNRLIYDSIRRSSTPVEQGSIRGMFFGYLMEKGIIAKPE